MTHLSPVMSVPLPPPTSGGEIGKAGWSQARDSLNAGLSREGEGHWGKNQFGDLRLGAEVGERRGFHSFFPPPCARVGLCENVFRDKIREWYS